MQGGRATQCSTCVAGPSSSRKVHAHAREVGTRSLGWTSWSSFLLYGDHLSLIKLPTIIPASHGFPRGQPDTLLQGGLTPRPPPPSS